jgi:transposase-like protein
MTIARVEVIISVQRRRSWSRAEKERLVAARFEPGRHGIGGYAVSYAGYANRFATYPKFLVKGWGQPF